MNWNVIFVAGSPSANERTNCTLLNWNSIEAEDALGKGIELIVHYWLETESIWIEEKSSR